MKPEYHRRITTQALDGYVSAVALDAIVSANLGQDALRFQFGHEHFHYDNNSFAAADTYVDQQRRATREALEQGDPHSAWQAFGRLIHTVQDFYAHSNYVVLWREHHPDLAADEILPSFPGALASARLSSGRLYYPLELFSFVPVIGPLISLLLPRDAHAWMNKDDPSRPDFNLAFTAAVKRTGLEFQAIVDSATAQEGNLFKDRS